jgi:hypothetical protein
LVFAIALSVRGLGLKTRGSAKDLSELVSPGASGVLHLVKDGRETGVRCIGARSVLRTPASIQNVGCKDGGSPEPNQGRPYLPGPLSTFGCERG